MSLKQTTRKAWESLVKSAYAAQTEGELHAYHLMLIEVDRYIHELEDKQRTKKLARLLVAKMDKEENGHSQ